MSLCPNCQQPLPDPPENFCDHCGAALGLRPAGPQPAQGSTPWEERARRGFVSAFFETTKQVLSEPTSFFRGMPVTGGIPSPMLYGVIVGYLGLLAGLVYSTAYSAMLQSLVGGALGGLGSGVEQAPYMRLMMGTAGMIAQIVLGPIQIVVRLFFVAAIYHLLLMLFGGARKDFEATFRVVCYGQAAELLLLVPVCGPLVGLPYMIVLYVIGLSEAHGISRGKAAAVVLVPILLACCCCALGLGVALGGIASILGQLQSR